MENKNEVNNLKNEQTNINKDQKNKKKLWIIISTIIIVIVGIIIYATFSEDNCTNINPINGNPDIDAKPIIYLYPEEEIRISVKLGKKENITCSYPEYKNGWNVIAKPDGTLVDIETGRNLYALYWEGIHTEECNLKEGFVVKGKETIEFLEEKLEMLGLNEREAEEFIVY